MTTFFKVRVTFPSGDVRGWSAATCGKKTPEQTCVLMEKQAPGVKYQVITLEEYKALQRL